ncbi:peroxidase family protein [Bradyrhizobium sp. SYSU BS000235]|uniref:peroxidase family protein n=1 Tax=Bradyrhizobium sp. SYSU BS000235 TaxID=3411332 RepID=UPI003C71C6A3
MAIQFRNIDGSNSHPTDPDMNQANTDFTRVGPANYADGYYEMTEGPNPREISNIVVAQPADGPHLVDDHGIALSGMMYAWGQFIDHDLDLQKTSADIDMSITVPADDQFLEPGSTIPLTRVAIDPATGVAGHPAAAINTVTGWFDGSQIYGSDAATAASLRTADGHMKVSAGNNLPIVNTDQGPAFLAGDVRAQENPDLTALQVLFVREHNYQVDQLHKEHPNWSGDRLYETAKAITTAEMVNITYNEYLPHLLGKNAIGPYHGYDPNADARISEEFAGAAFRFGHSIVSDEISATSNIGAFTSEQTLAESFFESPSTFAATGADGLLRHLGGDIANQLDAHIIDGLRNFLVDPPDGIDLAAINIQRGHDMGLGTLNQTREALGLKPYTSFDQITSDPKAAAALEKAYGGNVDAVDLWTGGLSENHAKGAVVGSTFAKIIGDQFTALRDGDKYYFENQGLDKDTLKEIKHTTLSDLILRDTDTTAMQKDAFVATERHSGTLAGIDPKGQEAAEGMAQLVVGSPGKDTLTGGKLDDTLVAASGKMTMTGGRGADTFVFNADSLKGHNSATITDYNPRVDKLQILTDAHVEVSSDHHGGTLLHVGNDTIDLLGVKPNDLHNRDWV